VSQSRKIIYLVTEDWYFWSHRLSLAEAARKQGHEVFVITNPGEFADRIVSKGFTLFPLALHRSVGSPFRELGAVIKLIRLYKGIKPDLVHHVALKPVILGSFAAWLAGVPHVVNAYTGLGHLFIFDSWTSRFFMSIVAPLMSVILKGKRFHSIVQNSDDEKQLLKLGLVNAKHVSLVRGSGVDTTEFKYSPEPVTDSPVVLFASRLLKDKGIIEFIEAAKLLKRNGTSARVVVVGELDEANPTSISKTELNAWIDQGIIEWWGYRDDMGEVFRQVHIVCLPSYREGLPKVLLEAAACGRPVVTTDVPGCRDIVIDGINGFLVPAKDHVSLAEAIHRLIESPDLRKKLGSAGRKRVVENFEIDIVNSATIGLYNKLLLAQDQHDKY